MHYVELLKTRRGLVVACLVSVAALLLNYFLSLRFHTELSKASTTATVPFIAVFAIAGLIASIFATVLGGLADDNDGHLSLAWTMPASRTRYAVQKFAVDFCAILFIFAFMSAVTFAMFAVHGMARHFTFGADWNTQALRFAMAPLGFYALTQALTASISKQAGLVRGMTWVAMAILLVLSSLHLPAPLALIVDAVNRLNPAIYVAVDINDAGQVVSVGAVSATLGLVAVTAIGLLAALYQWRRLEA